MIEIGTTKGFTIFYDRGQKLFILKDTQGIEVATAASQAELEAEAVKLSKLAFKSPIPALKVDRLTLRKGRVTSFNPDDKAAFFSFDDKRHFSHTKLKLQWDHAFELTEANSRIYERVEEWHRQIEGIEEKIKELISNLEKPLNLSYFDIKEEG